jgi:hypothetical protein
MYRWTMMAAVLLFLALSQYLTPHETALAAGPSDADNVWRTQDKDGNESPIEVDITSPADADKTGNPAAHYVPINHTLDLECEAEDIDSYCKPVSKGGDGIWYDYSDDVTSGTTIADAHMWWYISSGDGEFIYESGPPIVNHKYGTTGTYTAPDYSAGNDLRDVTLGVIATDMQLGGDTLGADDLAENDTIAVKVWQVTVTASQAGTMSGNNDVAKSYSYGDPKLGMVTPGEVTDPVGHPTTQVIGYFGNTEMKGTIPAGPGVTATYVWKNQKTGYSKYEDGGGWHDITNYGTTWYDDNPGTSFQDQDSTHGGTDVREVFMMDGPGFLANTTNDSHIAAPDSWTKYDHQKSFRSHVTYGGKRVSNLVTWDVKFKLKVVGGKWAFDGAHTP